ncbi:MAG: PAS domain S-box protein [Acidobacteriia bacterium]|nr:PAS domain S-box protein [Terriglobia bacterium]
MGAVLRHISRGKKTERYETVRVAKDGRRIDVAITSSPIINRMGELIGVSAITRDITDRKRAEEAVRERERTLFRFTEAAPVAIAMFDREMRFLAVSQRFREDYRLGEQELLGHSFYEFFPEIPQPWRDVHRRCLAGAVEQNPEAAFTRADGSEQWIRWEIQPWRQTDGSIGGIVLFSEDITQQKHARDAVRESEQQFRTLANAIPQLCSMATADGSVFWYNQRWYEYTGTSPEEMERRGWQSVHDPEVLPQVLERWNHSLRSGEPFEMVFPLRGADGVFRPFLTRVVPLRDRDGKVTRWFGTNTDISEQQTTEEKLRHALEQLDQAMEAGDLGAWDYRLETAEIFWDDRCRNMLGVRAGDRIDHEAEIELIHPEDRAAVVEAKRQALAGSNDGVYHREFRVIWPDGSVHWLASHGRAFFEDSGNARRAVRFIGVKMDITERKHAERQILELNATLERRVRERTAQLEDANRELEAFSYSVSHDLRAPLRSVEGFAKILLRDYPGKFLDETAADYMNRMSVATQRMGQLISDLLALSRLTRQEISRQPVNLSDIADSILKEYSRGEPGRNVQLEIEPGLVAYADPALTRVALENLLRNAWKYTSKTCTATIAFGGGASNSKKEATFFVRDNGAGFDMAHANQLFAPFQRLHRNEEFEGTGIGLATVQRIIRRHGGRVWADAKPGQGAVFFFTLGGGHDTNGQHAVGGG